MRDWGDLRGGSDPTVDTTDHGAIAASIPLDGPGCRGRRDRWAPPPGPEYVMDMIYRDRFPCTVCGRLLKYAGPRSGLDVENARCHRCGTADDEAAAA